uniref:Uncharacterized protein n=1 Tax=Tetranychus urticae TaxID=32264 RepID=T1K1M1_TETUR
MFFNIDYDLLLTKLNHRNETNKATSMFTI